MSTQKVEAISGDILSGAGSRRDDITVADGIARWTQYTNVIFGDLGPAAAYLLKCT